QPSHSMLPSSSSALFRYAATRPAACATTAAANFGGSPGGPPLPGSSTAAAGAEPGYLGYLSHAVTNIITNLSWNSAPVGEKENAEAAKKKSRPIVLKVSRDEVTTRTTALVKKLLFAEETSSRIRRIRELSEHLQLYPPTRLSAVQEPQLISSLLEWESSPDDRMREEARICLALCGFVKPPRGHGYNLLTIDGGGTRGMMGLEILEALEVATGKKVHELFDHVVGVSTGAIIAVMLGVKKMSVAQCRQTYMDISRKLFSQGVFAGATGLMLNHSYYDTKKWILMLKEILGDENMIWTAREEGTPKISIVSSIVNLPQLQPFIHRNYETPSGKESHYRGGTAHQLWQAVQASAAAPAYFEEALLGDILHQDGGVIANNPTAIGVHEARNCWPDEQMQCLVSIGNGRTVQELEPTPLFTSSGTRHKILKIIDSATDTESVHIAMSDLLPESVYYRFNPYMSHSYGLDEINALRLEQMILDAKLYVRRNEEKIESAAERLMQGETKWQSLSRSALDMKNRQGYFSPL
ncbi:hypothetical protein PENTCL1PPCAC_19391, partial [Pristionchus entomophagus]